MNNQADAVAGDFTESSRAEFNVIVLYDQAAAARRAMGPIGNLIADFHGDLDVRLDLWRFDVLGLPDARRLATLSAAKAEMVIVVMEAEGEVPAVVRDWISLWSTQNSPGSAALVMLRHSRRRPEAGPATGERFLAAVAQAGGHEFFGYDLDLPKLIADTPAVESPQRSSAASLMPGLPEHFHPVPHWGINE